MNEPASRNRERARNASRTALAPVGSTGETVGRDPALAMPPMELIPFSANGAGLALSGFGLALVTRDGLLALLSFAFTFGTLGWVGWALLA